MHNHKAQNGSSSIFTNTLKNQLNFNYSLDEFQLTHRKTVVQENF